MAGDGCGLGLSTEAGCDDSAGGATVGLAWDPAAGEAGSDGFFLTGVGVGEAAPVTALLPAGGTAALPPAGEALVVGFSAGLVTLGSL